VKNQARKNLGGLDLIIKIVTTGEIPLRLLRDLAQKLEEIYAKLVDGCLVGASLEIPSAAYHQRRNQYDADIILDRLLHQITGENLVLGIFSVDLYTSSCNLNFIFGQAQCPGRVALISLHRLKAEYYGEKPNYKLLLERTTKEAVHELGHTFGLGHCPNLKCVMSFSNSILDVDKKLSAFCRVCEKKLRF